MWAYRELPPRRSWTRRVIAAMKWASEARCAGVDPEVFFPASPLKAVSPRAAEICRACPVVDACLDYALDRPWISGVWAGTTADDRIAIRRFRTRTLPAQRNKRDYS